jgi:hypothetical protein
MVAKNLAVYEPAKQTRSILLYWRLPEEWAQVLHEWVRPEAWWLSSRVYSAAYAHNCFLGVLDRSAQYNHDVLRDRGTSGAF